MYAPSLYDTIPFAKSIFNKIFKMTPNKSFNSTGKKIIYIVFFIATFIASCNSKNNSGTEAKKENALTQPAAKSNTANPGSWTEKEKED
jgi:hypothetical protein